MSIFKKYSFLLVYFLIPLPFLALHLGGWFSFLPFLILFAFIPLIDAFIQDTDNPTNEQEKILIEDSFFKYVTFAYVPLQIVMLAYGAYLVSTQSLTWIERLGFATSLGLISGGVGINFAHEMMHKNSQLQQHMSKILLVTVCYGHFFIEHVKGHHVKVATPEDPATAQLGESLYQYLPKTLIGSFKSAFRLERKRLVSKGYSLWSFHNHFWWIISFPLIICIFCLSFGGLNALAFFLLQSFIAILVLEIVNYIEHYGLERAILSNGQYEKVSPKHSWNANHWLSNLLLIHLQRHSDHHAHGARPYQILRHMEQSPQLPSGYLGMIIIALIPPLWHYVMDRRVIAYKSILKQIEPSPT
ncbi:alkane 1-monooxygenase [Legionella norrlandica]|uniref:Alkane 1-monooxygenase n=1 Tax=Legionella norrlandica TaxID=1498499 RepID=A0A0A2T8L5_9GAMM|nr:alkane 1-monooxygenase [Legionella norrlandica]KGP63778.1 alkane 1-monooxygenase [Legionella norrlandica]